MVFRKARGRRRNCGPQRSAAKRRAAALLLIGSLLLGTAACDSSSTPAKTTNGAETSEQEQQASQPSDGSTGPERHVISTLDPEFDASHRISLEVPEGYGNHGGWAFLKGGLVETGVSVWVVDRVYAEGCNADESRLERSPDGSTDGLAALLASQDGFRVSTPTDVTVDGYSGTYMKRTLPDGTDPLGCYAARFQVWVSRGNGNRYLQHADQQDLLWIVDVDGAPLVIDAAVDADASAQDRAEVNRMVESIRISPT